ncbi:MAG: hypothetical protein WD275_08250 [Rhodothermales bacterium]
MAAVAVLFATVPSADARDAATISSLNRNVLYALSDDPSDSLTGNLTTRLRAISAIERDEVVWLARCIYSESDRPHEQELVAWVVRNRVETQYRGTTYREVVLEDRQFSAFNSPTRRREQILSLNVNTPARAWQSALGIALRVYQSGPTQRPFEQTVRHFYSPVSMKGRSKPVWADSGEQLSSLKLGVDPHRFRFFSSVDEGFVPSNGSDSLSDSGSEELAGGDDSGFDLPRLKLSGKIARPRRPSVKPARRDD